MLIGQNIEPLWRVGCQMRSIQSVRKLDKWIWCRGRICQKVRVSSGAGPVCPHRWRRTLLSLLPPLLLGSPPLILGSGWVVVSPLHCAARRGFWIQNEAKCWSDIGASCSETRHGKAGAQGGLWRPDGGGGQHAQVGAMFWMENPALLEQCQCHMAGTQ